MVIDKWNFYSNEPFYNIIKIEKKCKKGQKRSQGECVMRKKSF